MGLWYGANREEIFMNAKLTFVLVIALVAGATAPAAAQELGGARRDILKGDAITAVVKAMAVMLSQA